MFNFKVIRHDDYHGDPICFSIVDEDGHGRGRFPSERLSSGCHTSKPWPKTKSATRHAGGGRLFCRLPSRFHHRRWRGTKHEEETEMIVWTIESSNPHEFTEANCIAVVTRVADDKIEFDSFEEAVACVPKLQAENRDWDFSVGPWEKLRSGYAHCDDDRRRFFPGRLTTEAKANGLDVADWVRSKFGISKAWEQERVERAKRYSTTQRERR
jgi:hypothetical protein